MVTVPRELVPAAAQMLLDLASLRRQSEEDIPVEIDGRATFLNIKGNASASRRGATLFDGPAAWTELEERYHGRVEGPLGTILLAAEEMDDKIRALSNPTLPRRPCFLLPPERAVFLSATPYARHLGAFLLPATPEGSALCSRLRPMEVWTIEGCLVPPGDWKLHRLPAEPADLALCFQKTARQDHARLLATLEDTHPHLLASRSLLEEMEPSSYVVLAGGAESERPWAWLAAGYAAALGAPLLLFDAAAPHSEEVLERSGRLLRGVALRQAGRGKTTRDLLRQETRQLPALANDFLRDVCGLLEKFLPSHVGFVSSRAALPVELAGDPPLSTRFAVGRLAGPDLEVTGVLIARAALGEDVPRPPRMLALLAEAADAIPGKVLAGAQREVEALAQLLAAEPDIRTELLSGDEDLQGLLSHLGKANLVHFAGHGFYDPADPLRSGLVFRQGVLSPENLAEPLGGAPIIFSNACETGRLREEDGVGGTRAWSGLAASFLALGAVNYLGSLWPVFDEGSRRVSETFYASLCEGHTVGEALRRAKLDAYERNDPTWAAFALFGCPRNRLRARPEPR